MVYLSNPKEVVQIETVAVTIKINLTINEDIPRNSAIPPHTPYTALSVDDFLNFFDMNIPPFSFLKMSSPSNL